MRYRDLKQERDDAIARALEAERLSMKSEFDRVTREFEEEKARLQEGAKDDVREAWSKGYNAGLAEAERLIVFAPRKETET